MAIAKNNRIKKEEDFERVIKRHNSFANRYFVIYIDKNPSKNEHWRLGVSVGKKIGKANQRVWVKRRIRTSFNNLSDQLPKDLDFVVVARPITDGMSQKEIQKQIEHVLTLSGVINGTN